jgi:CheY-like chemotaxis protein
LLSVDSVSGVLLTAPQEQLTVLFVDDDQLLREFALENLRAHWSDVSVAADGEEALASIRASQPDIVLSDLDMPRLDGYGTLKALRAAHRTQNIPVLFATATSPNQLREGSTMDADPGSNLDAD